MPPHQWGEMAKLFGVAILFFGFSAGLMWKQNSAEEAEEEQEHSQKEKMSDAQLQIMETAKRFWETWSVASSMVFAWCTFFTWEWLFSRNVKDEVVRGMLVAVSVSIFCFVMIYGADEIMDRQARAKEQRKAEQRARGLPSNAPATAAQIEAKAEAKKWKRITEKVLKKVIEANGLLVGFGWERCFDTAVKSLADKAAQTAGQAALGSIARVVLAVLCGVLIVPAWRAYLLPMHIQNGWKTGVVLKCKDDWNRLQRHYKEWKEDEIGEFREKWELLEKENRSRSSDKTSARERRGVAAHDGYLALDA